MLTGGCFCGKVRYQAGGEPYEATLCHCADCRRAAGAPMVAWFTVKVSDYRIVAGRPATWHSSPGVTRGFCPDCGTQLSFQRDTLADEIDLTICSLDQPELVPPQDHIRTAGKLAWISVDDGRPAHPGPRPEG